MYGRQWAHPLNGLAFNSGLIRADDFAKNGKFNNALTEYHVLAKSSSIAIRRLCMIKRQITKGLEIQSNSIGQSINDLNIGFIDWYASFNENSNFILKLFRLAGFHVNATAIIDADIIIAGCYGESLFSNEQLVRDKLVCFVSGENLNPLYLFHDFSLTTLPNTFEGKNIRLPQWLGEILLCDKDESYFTTNIKRKYSNKKRNLAISAIYNNSTPHREEILAILRRQFGSSSVHVFGSHRGQEVDKFDILSKSIINVCFENSLGNGYITEKLMHARMMGCWALYWGDESYKKDFSDEMVFNLHGSSISSAISWCDSALNSPLELAAPFSNDWETKVFSRKPQINNILSHIREWTNVLLGFRSLEYFN